MYSMFSSATINWDLNLSNWDTSNVYSMSSMFSYATINWNLNLNNWDTSNVYDMSSIFYYATINWDLYFSTLLYLNFGTVSIEYAFYNSQIQRIYVSKIVWWEWEWYWYWYWYWWDESYDWFYWSSIVWENWTTCDSYVPASYWSIDERWEPWCFWDMDKNIECPEWQHVAWWICVDNIKTWSCTAIWAPEHASYNVVDISRTWNSERNKRNIPVCDWYCRADYHTWSDSNSCVYNTTQEYCTESWEKPANSIYDIQYVDVTWNVLTNERNTAENCSWKCDTWHHTENGATCIENTKMVACIESWAPDEHSNYITWDTQIVWSWTWNTWKWTQALNCPWSCDENYHKIWEDYYPISNVITESGVTFTYYDANISYIWNKWFSTAKLFTWIGVISISSWTKIFTMLDRNLWASNLNWYWYYYQWWNNYWFPNAWSVSKSSTQVDASRYWPWNYYSSNKFIIWYENWSSVRNDNLWWWVSWTVEAMQWPCPAWYHVPSSTDWGLLENILWYEYWNNEKISKVVNSFINNLYMPLAGQRDFTSSNISHQGNGWRGTYRASSAFSRNGNVYSLYFYSSPYSSPTAGVSVSPDSYRAFGYQIRCFKNTPPASCELNQISGACAKTWAPQHAAYNVVDVTRTWNSWSSTWDIPACDWYCQADYHTWSDGNSCVNTTQVYCIESWAKPTNSIYDVQYVDVTRNTWRNERNTAENCSWKCDTWYHTEDWTTCIENTKTVACIEIWSPDNSSYITWNVQITWSWTWNSWEWTQAANCTWSCNENYHTEDGLSCTWNTQTVVCTESWAPDNSSYITWDIQITWSWTWNSWEWTQAVNCPWSCDENNHTWSDNNSCELNIQQIPCIQTWEIPANSNYDVVNVTWIWNTWTNERNIPACTWKCDENYHTWTNWNTCDIDTYTITWKDDEGNVIDTTTVEYWAMPAHASWTKAATAERTYEFSWWSPELAEVTWNAEYQATFNATKNSYTITWRDDEGNVIDTTTVEYWTMPAHVSWTKEADAQYTYTFAWWTPEVVSVEWEAEYQATFTEMLNEYTVSISPNDEEYGIVDKTSVRTGYWANIIENGNKITIGEEEVVATANEATDQYTYRFTWWNNECGEELTWDCDIIANFYRTTNRYWLTFLVIEEWYGIFNNMLGKFVYTWEYGEWITISWNKLTIWEQEIVAIATWRTAEYTYVFSWWINDCWEEFTWTCTVTAEFSRTVNTYTITFKNEDGAELYSWEFEYWTMPTYSWSTPVKAATTQYTYAFSWWTPELAEVTWDMTYTAEFRATAVTKPSNGWWGWGGGWWWAPKAEDKCENCTWECVDWVCVENSGTWEIEWSWHNSAEEFIADRTKFNKDYSDEMNEAYQYAFQNKITTMDSIEKAYMEWNLTRIAMAKMLSQYAINVLWKTPDTTRYNKFADVSDALDAEYDSWVTLAYQLWIMWINMPNNRFRPDDYVPRSEFVTALSRMKYNTSDWEYAWTPEFYKNHMGLLSRLWIITNTNPTMLELRWYVMIMLMRAK